MLILPSSDERAAGWPQHTPDSCPTQLIRLEQVVRSSRMADRLTALRVRLARDAKVGKAAKARKEEEDGNKEPPRPLDWRDAFDIIELAAGFSAEAGSKDHSAPVATVAPYEVLEMLMRRAQAVLAGRSHADEVSTVRNLFTPDFLNSLVSSLYAAWEMQNRPTQVKMRAALENVLAVAAPNVLDLPDVFLHLRNLLVVDPPDRKRHLHILDVLLKYGTVEDFAPFAEDRSGADEKANILRFFLRTITLSEELAQLAGKVVVSWVGKCWDAGYTDEQAFWTAPTLEACRLGPKDLQKISTYVFPGLFGKRKAAFRDLLDACGCLSGAELAVPEEDDDLAIALDVVKVGNALNLVENETGPAVAANKIPFPTELLKTCLLRASPSLRSAALSVLVLSPSSSVQMPAASFPLLTDFFKYSLGEEDAEFRMHLSHLTGRLLLRLRDSSLKAQRTADKGKDGAPAAAQYVETVQRWLTWLLDLVSRVNLNPARPFRLKMNSLRILDHAFQARVDLRYRVGDLDASITGYSSYRRAATTTINLFQLKHRQVEQRAQASSVDSSSESSRPGTPVDAASAESGWPFAVDLVNPSVTQTLLRQLLSTYTALRFLVISTLERFPSPLPGYEGTDGAERARQELLAPALRMIRSGREAEASAGASVVGLVWRKWVFEDLRSTTETKAPRWTLGSVGGWQEGPETSQGPAGFAYISSLLDLADNQLDQYAADLASAAASAPMHGTLLALRHLLISIPNTAYDALSGPDARRALFHRILAVIRRVWEVTSPVLAASGPGDEADNEEARALRFSTEAGGAATGGEDTDEAAAEGSGGPQYKIILNACWRAMKEGGELLETILRIPSEFDTAAFRFVWQYEEICEIGDLFGTWLRLARHRGTVANLHPCYTRTAAALLVAGKAWPEVNELPRKWLDDHLEAIVSAGISTTRRSAALPFIILGLMMAILPYDRAVFDNSIERLFSITESTSSEIKDESRVHAMNTIRTIYLDSKGGVAAGKWIERGFILSLRLFWSPNWILRNVAMMLYASLVTRALHPRRVNLERAPEALAKRVSISDFFSRFPQLHAILLAELERGLKDSLDDLPSSNLDSPLFAILMLFGLLQTRESSEAASSVQTGVALSAPFIPLVKACARSRVWKIRGAAGDALTGLTPPSQVGRTCIDIINSIGGDAASLSANELHGRVVQVLRLLQGSERLDDATGYEVAHVYLRLAHRIFYPTFPSEDANGDMHVSQPYATLAAFMSIAPHLGSSCRNSPLTDVATRTLTGAQSWISDAYHLPSAEEYLRACWSMIFYSAEEGEEQRAVLQAGLVDRSLEVRREALRIIETRSSDDMTGASGLREALLGLVVDEQEAGDVRVAAAALLQQAAATHGEHDKEEFGLLMRVYRSTRNVPLRQGVLPLVASHYSTSKSDRLQILELLEESSRMEQTVEEREAAASALVAFAACASSDKLDAKLKPLFARILLRLLQDDDITVRESAHLAAGSKFVEGKAVEQVLADSDPTLLGLIRADEDAELRADCDLLANPSSLLFAVEKPNIFRDVLLVPSLLRELAATQSADHHGSDAHRDARISSLVSAVKANTSLTPGPLGLAGNELASRWAAICLGGEATLNADEDLGGEIELLRSSHVIQHVIQQCYQPELWYAMVDYLNDRRHTLGDVFVDFSVELQRLEDSSPDAILNEEDGLLQCFTMVCQNLRAPLGGEQDKEEYEAWTLESNTWHLLRALYSERLSGTPSAPSSSKNPYTPPLAVAQRLIESSKDLLELSVIRDWLHEIPFTVTGVEARRGYAPYTKNKLKQLRRTGAKAPQGLVDRLDPDALVRARAEDEGARLEADDALYERAFLRSLYEYVRVGDLGSAIDACRQSDQSWRAASLSGGQLWSDPMLGLEDEGLEDDAMVGTGAVERILKGNANRRLWKAMCRKLAGSPSLDKFEKALYGALSGDVASVLPVCSSWEDVVWAHVNSLFESHIEAGLASSPAGRYWQRNSVAPLNTKATLDPEDPLIGPAAASGRPLRAELEEVFENLIRSDQADLSAAAKNPFRVAQAYLITGKVGNLLETFVDRLEVAAVDTEPETLAHLLRFFSHLVLVLRKLKQPLPEFAANRILEAYVHVLEAHDQDEDLIAFYASHLEKQSAIESYARFLLTFGPESDINARQAALRKSREHGLSLPLIARRTVELILSSALESLPPSYILPSSGLDAFGRLDPRHLELIRSLEWLTAEQETYEDAIQEANALTRWFLASDAPQAARELLRRLPNDLLPSLAANSPDHAVQLDIREHLDYVALFTCLNLHGQWAELWARRPSQGASKLDVAQYRDEVAAVVDDLFNNASELLEGEWLKLEGLDSTVDAAASRRQTELERIRRLVVPDVVFRLHRALFETSSLVPSNLERCLSLATLVADERFQLYLEFVAATPAEIDTAPLGLKSYLSEVREASLASLGRGSGPFAVA
ncbi:hypothetical protein JCM10908_005823 [Rhodotorula pacifica]|uniref:uncharacterized protein n=1 Tax=Rhodotorula pacifica TaxID=1495444 RepID=UPI00317B0DD8